MALLPLEELFKQEVAAKPAEFSRFGNDYFAQYQQMVNVFRNDYYPKIDAALASQTDAPGFYTAHDASHFDEVVLYAGRLLGFAESSPTTRCLLNPYELYLLLSAIRVHDVGNIYGRKGHERKCFKILREIGDAAGPDDAEKKIVANIAQAHGGETPVGSKDTIGALEISSVAGGISYRPRLLAGIVRIADEICENRRRSAARLLDGDKLPKHSEIYHRYAAAIVGNRWDSSNRSLHINYVARLGDIERPWGCEKRKGNGRPDFDEVYLLDEVFSRLEKMDRERRYCNLFTRELFTIDSIKIKLDIVDDDHDVIDSVKIPELSDGGYPDDAGPQLAEKLRDYCGAEYAKVLRKRARGE